MNTSSLEADTSLRTCSGFQDDRAIAAIDCAANFGLEKFTNVSASEFDRLRICEEIVGSVAS